MDFNANEIQSRFWPKVAVAGPEECWEWTAHKNFGGYGEIKAGAPSRKSLMAHRVSYELAGKSIPDGLQLDHLCSNPGCVNPQHLEPVTCRENLMRGNTWAAHNASKTHCNHGHEFSGGNLRIEPDGSRACRMCNKNRQYAWRQRQKVLR